MNDDDMRAVFQRWIDSELDFDLDAPGFVNVAGVWRWTGAGDPPTRAK